MGACPLGGALVVRHKSLQAENHARSRVFPPKAEKGRKRPYKSCYVNLCVTTRAASWAFEFHAVGVESR
jgi:hypothetical protein